MSPDLKKQAVNAWYWPDTTDATAPTVAKRLSQIFKWAEENKQDWLFDFVDARADLLKSITRGETETKLPTADHLAARFDLTPAEADILELFLAGGTLREIADAQQVSINTVRTHFVHIRGKLDARDQADVVRIALFADVADRRDGN